MNNNSTKMKILLVSDITPFATIDVFNGYSRALRALGVDVVEFNLYDYSRFYPLSIALQILHSQIMLKKNSFTHVLYVTGTQIPVEITASVCGHVKQGILATEDPHAFVPMRAHLDYIDWYFSNENAIYRMAQQSLAVQPSKIHYLPTAADTSVCGRVADLRDEWKSDIVFVGSIYPSRAKLLEAIIPHIKEKGYRLTLAGHPHFIDKQSPLFEFFSTENLNGGSFKTCSHADTIKYYNGAKIVLNFNRDSTWNPEYDGERNPLNLDVVPESMNPRFYEVAACCGGVQLAEDTRSEARDFFLPTECAFFRGSNQLISEIDRLMSMSELDRSNMATLAYKKVMAYGTYLERSKKLLSIIDK